MTEAADNARGPSATEKPHFQMSSLAEAFQRRPQASRSRNWSNSCNSSQRENHNVNAGLSPAPSPTHFSIEEKIRNAITAARHRANQERGEVPAPRCIRAVYLFIYQRYVCDCADLCTVVQCCLQAMTCAEIHTQLGDLAMAIATTVTCKPTSITTRP